MSEVENRPAGGVTTAGPEEPYVKQPQVRFCERRPQRWGRLLDVRLAGATDRR